MKRTTCRFRTFYVPFESFPMPGEPAASAPNRSPLIMKNA